MDLPTTVASRSGFMRRRSLLEQSLGRFGATSYIFPTVRSFSFSIPKHSIFPRPDPSQNEYTHDPLTREASDWLCPHLARIFQPQLDWHRLSPVTTHTPDPDLMALATPEDITLQGIYPYQLSQ